MSIITAKVVLANLENPAKMVKKNPPARQN